MTQPLSQEINIEFIDFVSYTGKVYDLRSEFLNIEITESIFEPFTMGHMKILDINGITEFQDLDSGGFLQIQFRTNQEFSPYTQSFWIYRIGRDEQANESGEYQYNNRYVTISFASLEMSLELKERYSKYYDNVYVHEIVKDVCENMLSTSLKTIDSTIDKLSLPTVYAWSPLDIINFCKKKSKSYSYNDVGYLFYNNGDGYHYTSVYKLLSQQSKYKLMMSPPDNEYRDKYFGYINKIIDYKIIKYQDLIESHERHRFGGIIQTVDFSDMRVKELKQDYPSYLSRTMSLGEKSTTPETFNNDKGDHIPYYGILPEYRYQQYIRSSLLHDNVMIIGCSGDSRKRCGDIVTVNFNSKGEEKIWNDHLYGHFLVTRVTHRFNLDKKYTTELEVIKDAFNSYKGPYNGTGNKNPATPENQESS